MKSCLNLFVCLALSLLLLQCGDAFANGNERGHEQQEQTVEEAAKDSLQPPAQLLRAPSQLKGIVEVSFRITDAGNVDIIEIKSNNPDLIKYVVARLEKIKLTPEQYVPGKTINYRFSFGEQA